MWQGKCGVWSQWENYRNNTQEALWAHIVERILREYERLHNGMWNDKAWPNFPWEAKEVKEEIKVGIIECYRY